MLHTFEVVFLIWDSTNVAHIGKPNVTVFEVEIAAKDPKVKYRYTYDNRYMMCGRADERLLSVIISEQTPGGFYVVTARDMSKKERLFYREGDEKDE